MMLNYSLKSLVFCMERAQNNFSIFLEKMGAQDKYINELQSRFFALQEKHDDLLFAYEALEMKYEQSVQNENVFHNQLIQVITWYAPELQDKISSEDLWEEMGIVHQRQLKKILHCLEKKQGKEIGIQTDTIQEEEEWEMNKEREMKMEWNEKKKLKKLKEKENIMRMEEKQELDKLKNDEEKIMIMKMRKNKKRRMFERRRIIKEG